ncbi:trypsin, alkaline C-like [Pectinophora gossypiella]|uniref:Peptidase S1 domain-containing protein n=1 Tax=Pectinophora gossypiella TaxID=13191 RepID=A0A1E1W498_PECGO|nr:trypsin, alkaline C-like [Pectinophora gossypiella]
MTTALVVVLALFAGVCYGEYITPSGRIVGGEPTTVERYPNIVQVEFLGVWTNNWAQSCAANILTSRYLVSAAHCFDGIFYEVHRRRIRAGTTQRNTGGQVINVLREINHPSYGVASTYDGDINLVELVSPLSWNPVIQPGSIISQGFVFPDNTPVVHAGWGAISQGGPTSPVLLDVTIYTINQELCTQRYADLRPWPQVVTRNMICAGILDVGGKDACQGDSGGPLYYIDNYHNILVGVVSWGHGCANETYPGISTAVSPYTDWIVANAV